MASGICYTQSGNVKKYEGIHNGDYPQTVTVYTVGYPSTAYYPDGGFVAFSVMPYPPPAGYPEVEGFVEGTAHYITDMYLNSTGSNSTYKKIYDLMLDTPPDGYVLDKNGDYIVTRIATVYSYNYGIKYYDKTNTISGCQRTIEREFRYKKEDKPIQTTNIDYPVTISISGYTVHCSCERVTGIPGTNNGDFTLEVGIQLAYNNQYDSVHFKWQMKDGINEYKNVKYPYIQSSAFFTRNDWEVTNSDGNKTHYRFVLRIK